MAAMAMPGTAPITTIKMAARTRCRLNHESTREERRCRFAPELVTDGAPRPASNRAPKPLAAQPSSNVGRHLERWTGNGLPDRSSAVLRGNRARNYGGRGAQPMTTGRGWPTVLHMTVVGDDAEPPVPGTLFSARRWPTDERARSVVGAALDR